MIKQTFPSVIYDNDITILVGNGACDLTQLSKSPKGKVGGQILRAMGLTQLRLLASSTPDLPGLQAFGLTITGTVPLADDESDD